MEIVNFPQQGWNQVGASGECPHCITRSYSRPIGGGHIELTPNTQEWKIANIAQCENCKNFLLIVGRRSNTNQDYHLIAVYPLGAPNDMIADQIPEQIGRDFKEALRCEFVRAYKATVAMCRRAIQASALERGIVPKKKLVEQIDELAKQGIITEPLRQMAHEVRLAGNEGAHPNEDGLVDVTEEDAKDIIEFTREFFHHVYVMPAKLKARKALPSP